MKIGLDFDGVISDCGKLKSEGAKRLYNVHIPPERFKKELVVGEGLLSLEQYMALQKQIYGTSEIGLLMEPVEGVFRYLSRLREDGHELKIITSRNEEAIKVANEWMRQKGISLPTTNVPGQKTEACRGLDVYIDDDYDKLEPLIGIVPDLFLFSWGYNQNIHVNQAVINRVDSWANFYEEICRLEKLV